MQNNISSFDIFDTCIVRKCGNPKNVFDILSYRVFSKKVSEERRIEFITRRLAADDTSTFEHLYDTFEYRHKYLLEKEALKKLELECEREMISPVKSILYTIEECRKKGDKIIFISDMYLPTSFLKQSLCECGFFKDNDSIYVSGDCGASKKDGTLYMYIKEHEKINYSNWSHYGDNLLSDVKKPSELGIKTHHIQHQYLPYEELWMNNNINISSHIGETLAGIGRSIFLSIDSHPHNAFAIDITAPLTISFAHRIMKDAMRRGIHNLFFCSRDCYALYHVAKRMERLTPTITVNYFYTSRDAIYNTPEKDLISYLDSIGLAQKEKIVGIVDIRSTGKTLKFLNNILIKYGYKPLFGYYLEMYCSGFFIENVPTYYCEINALYCHLFSHQYPLLETFLSLCPDKKTIGYQNNQIITKKNDYDDDFIVTDIDNLSSTNLYILQKYLDVFIETELYRFTDEIFLHYVLPTLKLFFDNPLKIYLHSLCNLYIKQPDGSYIPYINKQDKKNNTSIIEKTIRSKSRLIRYITRISSRFHHPTNNINNGWWEKASLIYNENSL